jgi:uncharacterized protein DUF2188
MPQRHDIHVVPDGEKWKVRREGQDRAVSVHDTQAQAERAGRSTARQDHVEFNLHGRDGQVRVKDSYGNDPRRTKG